MNSSFSSKSATAQHRGANGSNRFDSVVTGENGAGPGSPASHGQCVRDLSRQRMTPPTPDSENRPADYEPGRLAVPKLSGQQNFAYDGMTKTAMVLTHHGC